MNSLSLPLSAMLCYVQFLYFNLPMIVTHCCLWQQAEIGRAGTSRHHSRHPSEPALDKMYLHVQCSPRATPSWEPHFGRAGQGPEMNPQKVSSLVKRMKVGKGGQRLMSMAEQR
jgi:hypothetical protein